MGLIHNNAFKSDFLIPIQAFQFEVCAEEYAAHTAPFFTCAPIANEQHQDLNTAQLWQSDQIVFAEANSNPFVRYRTKKEVQDAGHLLEVTRFISGWECGTVGEGLSKRVPGPIYVLDQGQKFRSVVSKFRVHQVYVPKVCLGLPNEDMTREIVIHARPTSGLLLHAVFADVYEALEASPTGIDTGLVDRFLALLKANLGIHPEREDIRRHYRQFLFTQICRCIDRDLGNPHLSADAILSKFGVSRASLYRMFEQYGGVRTYIMQRRVARAVMDLEERQGERGRLRQAVERWGFSSQPNFNRTIRRQFGTNPSGLFRTHNPTAGLPKKPDSVLTDFMMRAAA